MKSSRAGTALPIMSLVARAACLLLVLSPYCGEATEGGIAAFPPGGEDFAAAMMPPPGWYGELMLSRYHASTLAGEGGVKLPVALDLSASALTVNWRGSSRLACSARANGGRY